MPRLTAAGLIFATLTFATVASPAAQDGRKPAAMGHPDATQAPPVVLYDLSVLPQAVARMRARIIEAAATGDIEQMRAVLAMNEMPPILGFGAGADPIEGWRMESGDPAGREILAIMIEILEAGFVRLNAGTAQEMYVWPYFHAVPFEALTPAQEVELYKIITPYDRRSMEAFGAYTFYRLGLGPDGTWHYFVAGD